MMRSTVSVPDEIQLLIQWRTIFLSVKYNRVTQGLVNCGESARDVGLYTLDGRPTTLFEQLSTDQPTLIIAGSTS